MFSERVGSSTLRYAHGQSHARDQGPDPGEIVCALDELLLIAGERWRTPFSQHALARACGLSHLTINRLTPFRTQLRTRGDPQGSALEQPRRQRLALHTVTAICAALICLPGERAKVPGTGHKAAEAWTPRSPPG